MNKCTYTYQGKPYSSVRIKEKLALELPDQDQERNIEFLQEYLGMSRDEVIIVAGLIDRKSLGRFKEDGKILLSQKADIRIARHEAFHRVWRMYLTPQERADAIRQFKYKSNWKDLIQNYKKRYPNKSDEDLIEEYFADDFEDYQIQPDNYTEQPFKSLFKRLLNFIKKVLGLRNNDIKNVYERILKKEFKFKPNIPYKGGDADSVLIGTDNQIELSVTDRNSIVEYATQQIINKIINKDTEDFVDIVSDLKDFTWGQIDQYISEDIAEAIGEDFDDNGELWQSVLSKLSFYGFEVKQVEVKPKQEDTETNAEDEEILQVVGESSYTREFTAAIKVDPKQGLSARVKMLLASFEHPTKKTGIGVPQVVNASTAFAQVSAKMTGVPTSNFLEELEKLDLFYVKDLVRKLGKTEEGYSTKYIRLQNEFISKMALTENNFTFFQYGEDANKNQDIRFSNLNSETRELNLVRRWSNNFNYETSITEDADKELRSYFTQLNDIKGSSVQTTIPAIAKVFGIDLDSRVVDKAAPYILKLKDTVLNKFELNKTGRNFYDRLNIEGTVRTIAGLQAEYEENIDLMISVLDTKIYALGLNTYQTVLINKVKYFSQKLLKEGKSKEEIVQELRKQIPEVFNNWNMTKTENGWQLQPLLSRLLDSNLDLVIPYVAKNKEGDELYVDKMSEPELVNMHLNGAVTGNFMLMKHSDRSTFFTYKTTPFIQLSQLVDSKTTIGKGVDIITSAVMNEIQKEIEFGLTPESKLPNQYIGNKDHQAKGYSSLLGANRYNELLEGDTLNDRDRSIIYDMVEQDFKNFEKQIEGYDMYKKGEHTKGLSTKLLNEISTFNLEPSNSTNGFSDNAIRTYLMLSYVNEHLFHMYESRLFTGDNRMYKSATDLYKRLATQSSNGLLAVNNDVTKEYVRAELNQEYEVFNIETGKTEKINTSDNLMDDHLRSITLKEEDNYKSRLLQPSDKPSLVGIENPTKLSQALEYGYLQDFPNPTEEQKKKIKAKVEGALNAYAGINENDGQSYMSLPAFKNYMIRFGNWTDEMDVAYQVEMALLGFKNLSDAKNLEITITGNNKYAGQTFKPFEIGEKEKFKKRQNVKLEAMHTLKVQYAGPSQQEIFAKGKDELNYSFFTVFKTSNHLLQPSAIMGTNLQSMNYAMLKNNVQVIHMGSANKVGGVDPKLAAKRDSRQDNPIVQNIANNGLTFYKEGKFNQEDFMLASNPLDGFANTMFNWEYYKDQVKIGNKEKKEIPGSTQSLKIMLSNLIINGEERFPGAMDIVKEYMSIIDNMVKQNRDSFLNEINYGDEDYMKELQRVVMSASQIQNASDSVKNTVLNLFKENKGLETLTLRQKIENVLYSLVTNNVINFNRSGNAYPQAASTGYEPYNSRIRDKEGNPVSQELDFYEPIFDEQGNVISVKPAEIIIPIPTDWIPSLLKASNTTNLITALEWLNNLAASEKTKDSDLFLVKGLRIPNQQLGSNDIFRIKKFTLPTIQSYAIVPSEIVTKVGSDLRFEVRVKLG